VAHIKYHIIGFLLFFCVSSICTFGEYPTIRKAPPVIDAPVIKDTSELAGVWEDKETHNLHTIMKTENGFSVLSVIDYGKGNDSVEQLNLILSEWKDGTLKWGYHIPSTGYYVFFAAVSVDNDRLFIKWGNNDGEGYSRYGRETLRRMMNVPITEPKPDPDKPTEKRQLFGKIYKITGKDIIIASRNPGNVLKIGEQVYVLIDGQKVLLEVTFPMQTVAKCRLHVKSAQFRDRIIANAEVYK